MHAILEFGFLTMNLNRVYAVPYTVNTRSTKLLQRLGFRLEGIRREEYLIEGVFYDESTYAILKGEY